MPKRAILTAKAGYARGLIGNKTMYQKRRNDAATPLKKKSQKELKEDNLGNVNGVFYKNLETWSQIDPQASRLVSYVNCDHLHFCKTREGELNLKISLNDHHAYYHSQESAKKEAEEWFAALVLKDVEVLYVYGIGMGYAYTAARSWLKKSRKRQLFFLENDLGVIRRFLETAGASQILTDSQVRLIYFQSLQDPFSAITELFWYSLTSKIYVTAIPYYAQYRTEEFDILKHKLFHDTAVRDAILDEYLRYGIVYFRNFYPNILTLASSYLGDKLFGKFSGVPAIICGAGPSLTKQLPLLENLKDKALIFAGGSALNALSSVDIRPHLGAGIDPNPEQLVRLKGKTALDIPFFFRNRMYHQALSLITGPRLYISGSGGYDIAKWFEVKAAIPQMEEPLDEGFNVVNFCISIAHAMGCNPIILVGMDLAYTNRQVYAEGVIKENKVALENASGTDTLDDKVLLWKDIYGQPIHTLWKWIAEGNWIGEFAKTHAETEYINATEGGIGFPGISNHPFKEVIERDLTKTYPIEQRLTAEIKKAALKHITEKELLEMMQEIEASLQRCLMHLQTLIQENDALEKQILDQRESPAIMQSGKAVLAETELAEEAAYRAVLEIFNAVYTKVLQRELQWRYSSPRPAWRSALDKLKILKKRFVFLSKVTVANIVLIQKSLDGRKS
jgi:hypothetical protein